MATSKTTKGFDVTCPFCGDTEATVRIDLNDLTACTCSSCDAEFSPTQARDVAAEALRRWDRVVAWVAMATRE